MIVECLVSWELNDQSYFLIAWPQQHGKNRFASPLRVLFEAKALRAAVEKGDLRESYRMFPSI